MQRGLLGKEEALLIHGASGAVGLAAIQIAASRQGPRGVVVGTAGSLEGEAAVRRAGADLVLNHRSHGYIEEALAYNPGGYDVVLEMAAASNLSVDCTLLGRGGRVCVIGSTAEHIGLNPRLIMPNELDIRGVFLPGASREELEEIHSSLYRGLEVRALGPRPALEGEIEI